MCIKHSGDFSQAKTKMNRRKTNQKQSAGRSGKWAARRMHEAAGVEGALRLTHASCCAALLCSTSAISSSTHPSVASVLSLSPHPPPRLRLAALVHPVDSPCLPLPPLLLRVRRRLQLHTCSRNWRNMRSHWNRCGTRTQPFRWRCICTRCSEQRQSASPSAIRK